MGHNRQIRDATFPNRWIEVYANRTDNLDGPKKRIREEIRVIRPEMNENFNLEIILLL